VYVTPTSATVEYCGKFLYAVFISKAFYLIRREVGFS
jgi:hypothetical protein